MCSTSAASTRATTVTSSDSTEEPTGTKTNGAEASKPQPDGSPRLRLRPDRRARRRPRAAARASRPLLDRRRRAPPIPAQWPYAVAIFRKGHMHCSGSVIGPTKVLTAGHCVAGFNLANFQVIIGRPNLRDQAAGQIIGVSSGRVHPDFEQTGLHDVAVLNLAQPTGVAADRAGDAPSRAPRPRSPERRSGWRATARPTRSASTSRRSSSRRSRSCAPTAAA